ncbi:MAG: META domain-containing protein [Patescibacteria group bacterium]
MKKIIIGVLGLVVVMGIAGASYYFYFKESDYGEQKPPKDLSGLIVEPAAVPMKGKTFMVPNATSTQVTLDLVASTAKRDYPMGRFTATDGVTSQTLVALDNFTSEFANNLRAVPIMVTLGESETYYLAILEGEEMKHINSLPLGELIKIQSVTRSGNQVTVDYFVHNREQALSEVPALATAAIFDIEGQKVVQAGRDPKNETVVDVKSFVGEYLWKTTKYPDGRTVTPNKLEVFTMLFNANQISLGTDCNTGSATYKAETGSSTTFTVDTVASTKMFCEPGQEGEYFSMVQSITNYEELPSGALAFTLADNAVMTFTPKEEALPFASTTPAQ